MLTCWSSLLGPHKLKAIVRMMPEREQAVEIDYFFLVGNILNLLTVVFQGIDVNTDDEQGRAQAVERPG